MGIPLEDSGRTSTSIDGENTPGLKILGWMALTLVLVMMAIQLGQKIANKYDAKMQEQRMESLRTRTPEAHKKKD